MFVVIFATLKLCINPVLHLELLECLKVLNCLSRFLLVSLTSLSGATSKVKAMVCVSRLVCLSLCYLMDCRSSDSSVHGILQARILECVAIPFSRGSSWPIVCRFFAVWTTIIVVQLPNRVWLSATPWTAALQASVLHYLSLLKLVSIESVLPFNHLILCHPLHLLPSDFPSIRVFASELAFHIRWPKYRSFSISPSDIQGWSPLGLTGLISLQSKGFSRVFSSTTVQKHQFFHVQPSLWSNSHIHMWLLEKP